MFKFQVIEEVSFKFDEKIIFEIFDKVDKIILKEQNWILNIVFVPDEYIKELNKNYRWKDSVTDVLSFHYFDDFSELWEDEIAWEIILSESKIKSQGLEYWLWEEKEFYKLVIHSVLHILWYDHETDEDYEIMKPFEDKIWQEIFGNS